MTTNLPFWSDNHLIIEPYMLELHTQFLESPMADALFFSFLKEIPWQQHHLMMYGRKIPFPRLMCWMGQRGAAYSFSGNDFEPISWHPEVKGLKNQIENVLSCDFNSVLLNLYRNGQDSMSWHADNERELGTQPVIASVSLGDERHFLWKPKSGGRSGKLTLPHGSLLVMKGEFQNKYIHALPKSKSSTSARINLTFRKILH